MQLKNIPVRNFNLHPFEEDRMVCGLNALIEELNLPFKKITTPNRRVTADLLNKLSPYHTIECRSLISQCIRLQVLIELLCKDDNVLIEKVFIACEEKFRAFLKNRFIYLNFIYPAHLVTRGYLFITSNDNPTKLIFRLKSLSQSNILAALAAIPAYEGTSGAAMSNEEFEFYLNHNK